MAGFHFSQDRGQIDFPAGEYNTTFRISLNINCSEPVGCNVSSFTLETISCYTSINRTLRCLLIIKLLTLYRAYLPYSTACMSYQGFHPTNYLIVPDVVGQYDALLNVHFVQTRQRIVELIYLWRKIGSTSCLLHMNSSYLWSAFLMKIEKCGFTTLLQNHSFLSNHIIIHLW